MILNFNDENGKLKFEIVYEGFVLGGSMVQQKGLSILRRELSILDKLEAISHETSCGRELPNGDRARNLNKDGELTVNLDSKEFDILYSYITVVPWKSGSIVRKVLGVVDWLVDTQKIN